MSNRDSRNPEELTSSIQYDPPVIVPAKKKHTATVVFVHGSGGCGIRMKPFVEMLSEEKGLQHIQWVLPNAPMRAITSMGGMVIPSWYDIPSGDLLHGAEDDVGTLESVAYLHSLISELTSTENGVPADRVVLCGFSQGGTMSVVAGLTYEERLAGIGCMSGRAVMRGELREMMKPHAKTLPIFWSQGTEDRLITYEIGQHSVQYLLNSLGIREADAEPAGNAARAGLEFHVYQGVEHVLALKTLEDFGKWLMQVVPEGMRADGAKEERKGAGSGLVSSLRQIFQ